MRVKQDQAGTHRDGLKPVSFLMATDLGGVHALQKALCHGRKTHTWSRSQQHF